MKLRQIMFTLTVLALLAGALSQTGCTHTWHGAGQDVEQVGEKMQGHDAD